MKRTLLSVLCIILLLPILHIHVLASSPIIPVLLYHRLGNVQHPLYLSPEQFESQMRLLKEDGYTSLSLQEYENYITGVTANLAEKPILITFDDGDIDNYELAFPILKRYGHKATFFIPTDFLDQPERITSSQVLEMFHGGMSFGSHTATHRRLATLEKDEVRKELIQSRQTLESLLNQPVESIAYPGGSFNETTLGLAQAAGYKVGFSTVIGHNSRKTHLHIMKRIPVFNYSPNILRLIENAK